MDPDTDLISKLCASVVLMAHRYMFCFFLIDSNSEYGSNISASLRLQGFLRDEILVAIAGSNATVLKSKLWDSSRSSKGIESVVQHKRLSAVRVDQIWWLYRQGFIAFCLPPAVVGWFQVEAKRASNITNLTQCQDVIPL